MDPDKAEDLFSLLIGLQTNDKKVIRDSISQIMKEGIDMSVTNGFLGIYLRDVEAEQDIKELCSRVDLNGELVMSLLNML